MDFAALGIQLAPLPGAVPVRTGEVTSDRLAAACHAVHEAGGLLIALWGSDDRDRGNIFTLRVALQDEDGLVVLALPVAEKESEYPDLSKIFPAAGRMQRAAYDLLGVRSQNADARAWLRHASWPNYVFPLR